MKPLKNNKIPLLKIGPFQGIQIFISITIKSIRTIGIEFNPNTFQGIDVAKERKVCCQHLDSEQTR